MGTIVTLTMNPALDIATSTDRVEPTHKLRCAPPRYDPGGGGINVARAVHALGGDAVAIFPVGGPAGEMIHHLLDQEGVRHHPIAIAGFTRESLAVEDRQTGEQFRFILPGPEVSEADQERCLDQLSELAAEATYIVASGSLPLGVREDFYARVAELAQRLGKRMVLDTSGAALKQAGDGIHLLKPSLRELQDLVGREIGTPFEQECAAREVIGQGRSEIVVLSLGAGRRIARDCRGVRAVRRGPGRGEKHGRRGRQHAGGHRSRSLTGAGTARGRALRHGGGSGRTPRVRNRAMPTLRCRAFVPANVADHSSRSMLSSRTCWACG